MERRTCWSSSLNFSNALPTQNAIVNTQYYEYPCLTATSTDDGVPLEFRVDRTNQFVDLSQTYITFKVKIVKKDGTALTLDDTIAPVNNFAYSLFSDVDLFIQDQKITSTQGNYQLLTYVRMLLDTNAEEKRNYLRQALWFPDTAAFMDTFTGAEGATNDGFDKRAEHIALSQQCTLFSKVVLDFSISQLIPDQTELFFRFHRSSPGMCLLCDEGEFRVIVSQAKLIVSKATLTAGAHSQISHHLSTRGLSYESTRREIRSKMVSKNDQNCEWIPFTGLLPRRVYFFQILNTAYNGAINKNIFNFQMFDLKRLQLFRNGESLPLDQPLELSEGKPVLMYMFTLNALNKPENVPFNLWEYQYGYMIGCFDLTQDGHAGNKNYDAAATNGTVRIKIDYGSPLAEAVTVVCIGEYSGTLHIDRDRNPRWMELNS